MKFLPRLSFLLLLLISFGGCSSTSGLVGFGSASCVCGTSEADLTGCYDRRCLTGLGNPNNPACYCGGLAFAGGSRQLVSDGPAGRSRLFNQPQTLHYKSGKSVKGILVEDNGELVKLETSAGVRTIEYSELAPRSVYRLEKGRTSPEDGLGLVKLGDLARKAGYWAHASRHYHDALEVDSSLAPRIESSMADLRQEASQEALAEAQEELRKNKLRDAEEHLATIVREFPGEKAALEATALLERMHSDKQRTRSRPSSDKRLDAMFKSPREDLERAQDFNHKGLTNRNQSRALGSYRNALKNLEKARKKLLKIEKNGEGDRQVIGMAEDLDAEILELYVTTTLNMVSVYMVQTSYNKALEAVNNALALAPKDQRLYNTRARIESATADSGWGFGWVRSGR